MALIAFTVLLIDMGTKAWALGYLADGREHRILGDLLSLQLTTNSGAAFNLATSRTLFLTSFSAIALLAILLIGRRLNSHSGFRWSVPLGLALGGVMGNLSDRIFREPSLFQGEVTDWIKIPHWPTFNIADSSLVMAAVIALYLSYKGESPFSNSPHQENLDLDSESNQ